MTCCLELAPRDDGAILALAYLLLGARAGEVVLRQVRDVDDGGRPLWIPDSKTEAGRRHLEVPDVLVPHLIRFGRTWSDWPRVGCRPRRCSLTRRPEHAPRTGPGSRSYGSASSQACLR